MSDNSFLSDSKKVARNLVLIIQWVIQKVNSFFNLFFASSFAKVNSSRGVEFSLTKPREVESNEKIESKEQNPCSLMTYCAFFFFAGGLCPEPIVVGGGATLPF